MSQILLGRWLLAPECGGSLLIGQAGSPHQRGRLRDEEVMIQSCGAPANRAGIQVRGG